MGAGMREPSGPTSLEAVADFVDTLSRRDGAAGLRAAITEGAERAVGARAARLVETSSQPPGPTTEWGTTGPDREAETLALAVDDREIGHLLLWGAEGGDGAMGARRVLARGAALALDAERARDELERERALSERFVGAVESLRYPAEPDTTVKTVLSQARSLLDGDAAVLVAAGDGPPSVAAQDGTDRLDQDDLAALLPLERRHELATGAPWSGSLSEGCPLRGRGFASAAFVSIGGGASLGYLGMLSASPEPLPERELLSLGDYAVHAGAAMISAVLQQEVRDLTAVDPVTRLFNARYFSVRVDQEAHRAQRGGYPLCLAVMMVDGAGDLRTAGRGDTADALLAALAQHAVPRLRISDVCARIAEDELALVLPETATIAGYAVGERLRTAMRDDPHLGGCTLSVGVASLPEQAEDAAELVEQARSAVVWARHHGGDRSFVYDRAVAESLLEAEREERAREESLLATLSALTATIDARQPGGQGHSERVARVAFALAKELGMSVPRAEQVRVAALLHDIGKVGLDEDLLAKDAALEPHEQDAMRGHPETGHRMLAGGVPEPVREWVLRHHERIDGSGYPGGLAGDDIPLPERIIAVADAYDRARADRPGEPPHEPEDALDLLRRDGGTRFDPSVLDVLLELVRRREPAVVPTSVRSA